MVRSSQWCGMLCWALLGYAAAIDVKGDLWQCAPRPDSCDGHREKLVKKNTQRMASRMAAPFMVDWNGDGHMDLLVGDKDGTIWYYEKNATDGLLNAKVGDASPFRMIQRVTGYAPAGPVAVDWDRDGELDLILARAGHISFFKRINGELVWQDGDKNPFQGITFSHIAPRISVADWDGDGDMDLILPRGRGLVYFEQVDGKLVERTGDSNPFMNVQGAFIDNARGWDGNYGAPHAVDWDGDGDLDLIYGQVDGTVLFFERLASARLAQRNGIANPFGRIKVGHFAAVQAVDYNGDGRTDVLTGNQDGHVTVYVRERDVRLQEREGIANPFYDIGILRNAVPAAPMRDETGALYFMFQETQEKVTNDTVARVQLFKRLEDGSFENVTRHRPPREAQYAVWLQAGRTLIMDWNGDGENDRLTIYHNGTIDYKENVNGNLTDLGTESPFYGLSFGSAFSDANVSGYLPLDLYGDGRKELLVAEWGNKKLRFFETAWCALPNSCNNRGVCAKNTGKCSCMLGYAGPDCSQCTESFFTDFSDKLSDYPGFVCRACPGRLGNGTCSGRGICEDDQSLKEQVKAEAPFTSPLQMAFIRGEGTCSCSPSFTGANCEEGMCPAGTEYAEHSIIAHCEECEPGFYKPEIDNTARCRTCPPHYYTAKSGTATCEECIGSLFIYSVNKDHTECRMDFTATLPVLFGIICWSLTFYFAPMVFGLPIVIADISLGPYLPSEKRDEEGEKAGCCRSRARRYANEGYLRDRSCRGENLQCVKVKSHGNHFLLRGQRATIYFRGTGDPRLDTKRFDFKVEGLTHHELLLLNLDGTPVSSNHDSSTGYVQVKHQHAMLRMGMFGLPFIVWTILPIAGYAALLAYLNSSATKFLPSTSSLHVAIGCLISIMLHSCRYKNLARTRLKKDIRSFIQRLKTKNPNPARCPRGPSRAITAGQLKEFDYYFHGYHGSHRTMYYVCHNIILQLTHPFKLSYAELAGPTTVTWFVSHYWGTSFRHFVDTISKHSDQCPILGRRPSQQPYWICSFSNNQWAVEEEVGKNWDESSFYLAMRSDACRGTVMVFDEDALPLTRSWCLFELLQTHHFKQTRDTFAGLMLCSANGVMNKGNGSFDLAIKVSHKLANLDLREARASKESDKQMIEELVRRQAGFKNVRTFLTNAVEEVLLATRARFQDKMTELQTSLALTQSDSPTHRKEPEPEAPMEIDPEKEKRPALLGSLRKAYTSLKSLERVLKRSGSGQSSDGKTPKEDLEQGVIPEEAPMSPTKDKKDEEAPDEEDRPSKADL
ncbi:Tenascin-X (TN-X) (Hexabrachion-like protein) [Durusdinium trenchii]|uniref:Tenascin-X (TN-X) (Hexabrachion-like protein) n=1 Tax=Durusdinium trenchii TaxID=1381693 RepID=A0ABP0QG49_9DINO